MVYKNLFLLSLFITYSCFSMDQNSQRSLLGSDGYKIHCFLTIEGDRKDIPDQLVTNFINALTSSNASLEQLCNLPDNRQWYGSYNYTAQAGEHLTITSYNPQTGHTHHHVNDGNQVTIHEVPVTFSITRNGEKREIRLVDAEHTWFPGMFNDIRTYNFFRLLFDCDRVNEAQRILSSVTNQKITIYPQVQQSFEKMYARVNNNEESQHKKKNHKLQGLKEIFANPDNAAAQDNNCCATTGQGALLITMLAIKGGHGIYSARNARWLAAAGIAFLEWAKQTEAAKKEKKP